MTLSSFPNMNDNRFHRGRIQNHQLGVEHVPIHRNIISVLGRHVYDLQFDICNLHRNDTFGMYYCQVKERSVRYSLQYLMTVVCTAASCPLPTFLHIYSLTSAHHASVSGCDCFKYCQGHCRSRCYTHEDKTRNGTVNGENCPYCPSAAGALRSVFKIKKERCTTASTS